jgi:phage-related minor tail protein
MGDVINLNQARKARERQEKTRQADANRVRFGRNKGEKLREASEAEKLRRELEGKKKSPPEGGDDNKAS